jgi:ADP-heptose:LPS heptosyltransferase
MAPASPNPVVISPFANERVRQWPSRHFRELIEIIWREHRLTALIVGTRAQRAAANDIVRGLSSERVKNACGSMSWGEVMDAVDAAPYVVANNSGVAHLAAAQGRWTLCIFSASHAYNEWMPRGPFVVTVTKALPCSPCGLATDRCPNGVACMVDMPPSEVFWRFHHARNIVLAADRLPEQRPVEAQ